MRLLVCILLLVGIVHVCTVCPAGQISTQGSCQPCEKGNYPVNNKCEWCPRGTYADREGQAACTQCAAGKKSANGPISISVIDTCTTCAGIITSSATCTDCGAGTFSLAGASACKTCTASFQFDTGKNFCYTCNVNAASPDGGTALASCTCNTGYTGTERSDGNGIYCKPCEAGTYKTTTGNGVCTACVAGQYSTSGSGASTDPCKSCHITSISPVGSSAAESCTCKAGYTGPNGVPQWLFNTWCQLCAKGTYKASTGSVACVSCGGGKYSTAAGATTADTCQQCPAGKWSGAIGASAAGTCVECPAGTWSHVVGASANPCQACAIGRYSRAAGAGTNTCANCPADSSAESEGASVCAPCRQGGGTSHTANPTGNSFCFPCNPGFHKASADGLPCDACAPGKFGLSSGLTACTGCAAGLYSNVSGASTAACRECGPGKYAPAAAPVCIDCAPGSYGTAVAASACLKCNDLRRPRQLYAPVPGMFSCSTCPDPKEISDINRTKCFSCADGQQEDTTNARCLECPHGKYSDSSTGRICTACRLGTYANEIRSAKCKNCLACPDSFYRAQCTPTAGGGVCKACPLCKRDQVRVDCLNRAGHSDESGVCRPRKFMVKTALCDEKGVGSGLGGYGFAGLFGVSQDMAPFQCRRRCDGETNVMTAAMANETDLVVYKNASFDSGYCKGPFACDVHSCVIFNPSNDWDASYMAASACPVHIDVRLEHMLWAAPEDARLLAAIKSMRNTGCSSCERCGYDRPSAADAQAMQGFATWGAGCVRECTETLCGNDQVWDWTEAEAWKKCKPCTALSDVRLCPTEEQQYFVASDVSGNFPKIMFEGCHGKSTNTLTNRLEAMYGSCVACPADEDLCQSGEYYKTCRWDDEDRAMTAVPDKCHSSTSVSSYYFNGTVNRKVYCQKRVCGQDRTGVTVDVTPHTTCNRRCQNVVCVKGQVLLPCVLPHYARCVSAVHGADHVRDPSYVAQAHSPGHANLLEPVDAAIMFSSFENVLLSVDSEDKSKRRVCVWNADDIVDNTMNPGGVSVTFQAACREWSRDVATQYPLLPLQNTVLMQDGAGIFYRRLLLNTSACAAHYSSKWRGMPREYGKSSIPGAFSGDVFLDLDLTNTTNATLAAFVPDDRGLAAVTSISRWRVSVYAQQTLGEPSLVRIDTDTGVHVCNECFTILALPMNGTTTLRSLLDVLPTTTTTTPTRTSTTTPAPTSTPTPAMLGTRPATVMCSANGFSACLCQPSSGTSSGVISVDTSSRQWDTDGNKFCQWTIASDGIINLTFTSFSTEWAFDFVTVKSCTAPSCTGVNQRLIAKLSGSESSGAYGTLEDIFRPMVRLGIDTLTAMYTSNTGYMRVEFTADPFAWGDGVTASWYTSTRIIQPPTTTTVTCSSTSAWSQCRCQPSSGLTSGEISLNTASQGQTQDGNCRWTIASDGIIRLSFASFSSEYAADYVTVNSCTDSSCTSSQIIAKLSGSNQGVYGMQADGGLGVLGTDALTTIYTSSTGYMQVEFTSDYYVFLDGFVASWCTGAITAPACTLPTRPSGGPNATVTCSAANAWSASACQCTPSEGTSSGVISANTASGTFHSDANCQWTINVRFGGIIRLSFKSFDTEKRHDYVTVKSCNNPSCDSLSSEIIAKLSGNSWPGIGVYGTTTHAYLDPTIVDGGMDDLESEALTTTYNSSTGYMQVELTTDFYGWRAGFTAWWCTVSSPDETCTYTPPARAIPPPATTTTTTTPTPAPAECTGSGRVTCNGYAGCLCEPSDGISNGVLSDGDGSYLNDRQCSWDISSNDVISLSFTSFDTEEGFDYVILQDCSDLQLGCVNIAKLSGSNSTRVWGSKADGRMGVLGQDTLTAKYTADGYMSVSLQTDYSEVRDGFTASLCFIKRTTTPAPPTITTTPAPPSITTTPAPPSNATTPALTANVTCSGGCLCVPSNGMSSGVISDGDGFYSNNLNCKWIIASSGIISLSFTSFVTEYQYDYVTVKSCSDPSCELSSSERIVKLSGANLTGLWGINSTAYTGTGYKLPQSVLTTIYTSSTGYMQVEFYTDANGQGPGFGASWSIGASIPTISKTLVSMTTTTTPAPPSTTTPAPTVSIIAPTKLARTTTPATTTPAPAVSIIAPTKLARTTTPATTTPAPAPMATVTCASTTGGTACHCQPSTGRISGVISARTAEGEYVDCVWIIASAGIIHLNITHLYEDGRRPFIVSECTNSSCTSSTIIVVLTGNAGYGYLDTTATNPWGGGYVGSFPTSTMFYTSTTGYMQVGYRTIGGGSYEISQSQGFTASWSTAASPAARRRRLLSSSSTPAPANGSRCGSASYAPVYSTYEKAWPDFDGDKFLITGSPDTYACGRGMQQRVEGLGPACLASHHSLAVYAGVVSETCDAESTYTLPVNYSMPERLIGSSGVIAGTACLTIVFSRTDLYCFSVEGVLTRLSEPAAAVSAACSVSEASSVLSVVSLSDSILATYECSGLQVSFCLNVRSGIVARPDSRGTVAMHATGVPEYHLYRNDNDRSIGMRAFECSNLCALECSSADVSPIFHVLFSVLASNTFFSGNQDTVVMATSARQADVTYVTMARHDMRPVVGFLLPDGETEVTADADFGTRDTQMDANAMSGVWIAERTFMLSFEYPRMMWRCTVDANITVEVLQPSAGSLQVPFFRVGSAVLSYASTQGYALQACMPTCRRATADTSGYFAFGSAHLNYTRLRPCNDGTHYVDPSEWNSQPVHTCVSACWNSSQRPTQYAVVMRCKTEDRVAIMSLTLPPEASVTFDEFRIRNDEAQNATVVVYAQCRGLQPSRVFVVDTARCTGTCAVHNQSRILLDGGVSVHFVVEARLPPTTWQVRVMMGGGRFWSTAVESLAPLGQWSQPHVFVHNLQEKQSIFVNVVRGVSYASLLHTVTTAEDEPTNVALDVLEVIPTLSDRAVLQVGVGRQILFTVIRIPSDDDLARLSLLSFKAGHDVLNWRRLHAVAYLRSYDPTLVGCVYKLRVVEVDASLTPTWPAPELGCDVNLPGTADMMTAKCHLEIPYGMANADSFVGMYVSSDDEVACALPHPDSLSLELPPFVAMQNCTEDAYLHAGTGKCVSCESADKKCGVGFYAPACEALLPEGRRPNCSACDAVAHAVFLNSSRNCADWVCAGGWYKADDACVACTTLLAQVCGRTPGTNWSACSTRSNEECRACDELVRPRYAVWTNQSTCAWRCQAGFFETGGQCYACMSLGVLKVTLQFGGDRQPGTFYKFEPCNATQQARFTPCEQTYLGNGSYTADAAAFLQHCPAACAQDRLLHLVSLTYTDGDGLVWDTQQCVLCPHEALPIFPNGSLLPAGAFRMNRTCYAACVTTAGFHPGHARNTSAHGIVCVHCPESKCGFGEYLRTENECSQCHACVSRLQNNSVFTSTGRVDAEGSCAESCSGGYFYDESRDLCAPHSDRTCEAGIEYKENGTAQHDSRCVICTDCSGTRQRVACSANADAQCESCGALVWWTSYWRGVDCSLQCKPSFTKLFSPAERCQQCSKCPDGSSRALAPANCSHCLACEPPKPENAVYVEECTWTCFDFHSLVETNGTSACVYNAAWRTSDVAPVARMAQQLVCDNGFRLENYACMACETPAGLPNTTLGAEWVWTPGACAWECMPERNHFINKTTRNNACLLLGEYKMAVLRRLEETPVVQTPTRVNFTAVALIAAVLLLCGLSCGAMGVAGPTAEKGYSQVPFEN